ncbi:hypothetical protein BJY52DRAFT_1216096 [Lactarius psammicola]|nr:hypothetical protein BJY52DRAFT_1216096 [Lactarius psammicola]
MSGLVPSTQLSSQSSPLPPGFTQSQASVLGPGIAGLFIQGIQTGLVFSQFAQWFATLDGSESSVLTTIVIFVTIVGLAQSGVCFASAWRHYVQNFGMFLLPGLEDNVHPITTLVIAVPVQALMIRRCYYLVSKNMFIITPLVLLLVASIATTLWAMVIILRFYTTVVAKDPFIILKVVGISWPFLMSVLLPSVLDLILSGILLHYLTRTMKQVYATHTRKRIYRLVNIVWQSALPPTVCAIFVSVLYIQYTTARQKQLQLWLPVIQAFIGKLYVLSLFYMINAHPPRPDERPTTILSTLTVPAEAMYTISREARGRDVARSDITAERGTARTVDFAV